MKGQAMTRKLSWLWGVAAMVAGTVAQAAAPGLGIFSRMDGNGDGKVSLAEFQAGHAAQLGRLDGNQNGTVTIAEVDAFFAGHAGQGNANARLAQARLTGIKAADSNGDGVVSAAEFATAGNAEFQSVDSNGDGFITAAEAQNAAP